MEELACPYTLLSQNEISIDKSTYNYLRYVEMMS